MSVLVVNAGSSSVKYALLDTGAPGPEGVLAEGLVERVGADGTRLRHDGPGGRQEEDVEASDHTAALAAVGDAFDRYGPGTDGLTAVGHRVVHGGDDYSGPVLVDDDVLAMIERLSVLAPLHNPVNVAGIRAARERFPDVPHVAVFDTAFHADLPAPARTYAVPREWEREHGVRRYGFHGTSHAWVSREAGRWLQEHRDVDPGGARVVVLHLGNGASACAVRGGLSVDTSMGLTPLQGLVMGTRSGDVDPAVFGHLDRVAGMGVEEVEEALNRKSGLLGLCGDGDVREVVERAGGGDAAADLALDVYAYRIRAYLGAYAVALGGLDAVAFTAGVGENSSEVRRRVLDGLEWLGLRLDEVANSSGQDSPRLVSRVDCPVAALVVATDEEREIAVQTAAIT